MKQAPISKPSSFQKIFWIQWIIIGILTLALIYAINSKSTVPIPKGGSGFIDVMDDPTAVANVKLFRMIKPWTKKGNGVWYDTADLKFYVDSIYPRLVDAQREWMKTNRPGINYKDDTLNHEWKLACYWMLTEDPYDHNTRPDFCVVPVLVRKGGTIHSRKDVIDYFDKDRKEFYNHAPTVNVRRKQDGSLSIYKPNTPPPPGGAFNTGTMFP
jgi:hypothetical protein